MKVNKADVVNLNEAFSKPEITAEIIVEQSVSIATMLERLHVSKPTLYNYMAELGVTPVRQGRQAYVTTEESEWVAALSGLLKSGEATSAADAVVKLRSMGLIVPGKEPETKAFKKTATRKVETLGDDELTIMGRSSEALVKVGQAIMSPLVEAINYRFNVKADVKLTPEPTLKHYENLEKAYEKGWLLSTSELAGLLKMSPGSIQREFERGSFRFVKAGKNGRESAWKVLKSES